jgi:hypothetical protein
MNLESLLHQTLSGDAELSALLTRYNGIPAVFEMWAPPDTDPGWSGNHTPRIEFYVNREEEPVRYVSGQVSLSVIHGDTSKENAAQIEIQVRRLLNGATFRPDEGTITLKWNSSELFDEDSNYRGVKLMFDLISWPAGLTYAPDPVKGLRNWSAGRWNSVQVDPLTWAPTDTAPALYWRLSAASVLQMQPWGAWMMGTFNGHILANSPESRLEWVRRVAEGAALDKTIPLEDGSRLFIESVTGNSEADPLRTGQLSITARFGVLMDRDGGAEKLNRAHISVNSIGEVNAP